LIFWKKKPGTGFSYYSKTEPNNMEKTRYGFRTSIIIAVAQLRWSCCFVFGLPVATIAKTPMEFLTPCSLIQLWVKSIFWKKKPGTGFSYCSKTEPKKKQKKPGTGFATT
jgi:hypothetical protein